MPASLLCISCHPEGRKTINISDIFSQGPFQLKSLTIRQSMNVLHLLFSPWRRPRTLTFSASIKADFPAGPLTAVAIVKQVETQYWTPKNRKKSCLPSACEGYWHLFAIRSGETHEGLSPARRGLSCTLMTQAWSRHQRCLLVTHSVQGKLNSEQSCSSGLLWNSAGMVSGKLKTQCPFLGPEASRYPTLTHLPISSAQGWPSCH